MSAFAVSPCSRNAEQEKETYREGKRLSMLSHATGVVTSSSCLFQPCFHLILSCSEVIELKNNSLNHL